MKRNQIVAYCGIFFALATFATPAFAYLDPGSGSVLLQSLIAGGAGILAIVKLYWQRIKQACVKLFKKKTFNNSSDPSHDDTNR